MSMSISVLANLIKENFEVLSSHPIHCNGSSVAIFIAKTNGKTVLGWHYARTGTKAGTTFHYDHGAGINRNNDGTYIFVAPSDIENLNSFILDYDNLAHKFSHLL